MSNLRGMHYTGIGSRETPGDMQQYMVKLGHVLAAEGLILRSGAALGADWAFEQGCDKVGGVLKQIFLPWDGFQPDPNNKGWRRWLSEPGCLLCTDPKAEEIAAIYHPAWGACSQGARKLHTRNVPQVLGMDLATPSKFVLCWAREDGQGNVLGGTGQAVRIARALRIPVFNLWREDHRQALPDFFRRLRGE